jgi:phosphotriesterase-related protein
MSSTNGLTGKVQTVLGTIAPEELGITLPHEHLFADITCLVEPPFEATQRARAHQPVSLENLGWIRYNYFRNYDNSLLTDEDTAVSELDLFHRAGGSTIVDVSTVGIGRDPIALARVARASGVNVVMATGYYVDPTHPASVAAAGQDELTTRMVTEIREGAILDRPGAPGHDITRPDVHTDIRAGVIKIGCSYPLTVSERKVIHAAAEAQRQTGAPITFHVGRHDQSANEIIGVLREAGADMAHTVLGHLELRIERLETLDEVAESGCFLEFDMFGHEGSYFPNANRDMPNDAQRLDLLQHVKELGLLDRLLVSHDICNKHRLSRYGGHGYAYIPECVAPRMRAERGFTEAEVRTILVSNPAQAFAFRPPAVV